MSFNPDKVTEISVQELKQLIDSKVDFQLVDVREKNEYEEANLNGLLIPLSEVSKNVDKISKDKKVVIHCRSGRRSATAIAELQKHFGFENLVNLKGGILSWIEAFGPVQKK